MKNIQVFKPYICDEAINAVSNVLRSGWIGRGDVTSKFENEVLKYLNCSDSCAAIAVNSATSGLHLALELLDIKEGDKIITTANTFISTNHVILYKNAIPVFCDIDDTGCIDVEKIEEIIKNQDIKAIILVHYSGLTCDIDKVRSITKGIPIIHDCAHAFGSVYKGVKVGNVSKYENEIAVFSFQAVKNLAIGDSGMVICNKKYEDRARRLIWMGIDKDTKSRVLNDGSYKFLYSVNEIGYKYHTIDILSAIGIEQLKNIEIYNNKRREICNKYKNKLSNYLKFALPKDGNISSCHFIPGFTDRRNELLNYLSQNGIHCGVHYIGNHRYKIYKQYYIELPNTDRHTETEITLPCHLLLTDDDVDYIINCVIEFYESKR